MGDSDIRATRDAREATIRRYFEAWLQKESARLPEIFREDARYDECYGPCYRGLAEIARWFAAWNARGTVTAWEIRGFLHDGDALAVDWFFACEYDGALGAFDGVSWVTFDSAGRVASLREFQSKLQRVYPFGNP